MTSLPGAFDGCAQLSLDLFPAPSPPSFESLLDDCNMRDMNVTVSPRLRRGWYMKIDTRSGTRRLVVPAPLETAPHEVKAALLEWTMLARSSNRRRGRCDATTRSRKKELEHIVYRHLESSGTAGPGPSRFDPRTVETRGCRYDLAEVFDTLNRVYFNAELVSYVRWGKSLLRSYQSNKYDRRGTRYSLITIAAMYDRPDVPRFAIEGIMYHEMLHIAVPPVKRNGRNVIHGADFRHRERLFPCRAQWLAWEKTALKHAFH